MSESTSSGRSRPCIQFEANIAELMEGTLPETEERAMFKHAQACSECALLLAELNEIVHQAALLPVLQPSRDLWPDIFARIDAGVRDINSANVAKVIRAPRRISMQTFAIAAAALIMISSGVTYAYMSRARELPLRTDTIATVTPQPSTAAPVARSGSASGSNTIVVGNRSAESTYEHEIAAMRRIVDERLGDLDSTTVVEIRHNLDIIDKAITDSRSALQKDPRSRFLSTQLDRALENKLDVMRRVALL